MNTYDKDKLRRRMGEIASLPACDEQRREVESVIADEGSWAENEWLDLLREDEALRLELRRVETPPGLHERLHRIPEQTMSKESSRMNFGWWLSAAAAVAVLLASWQLFAIPETESHSAPPPTSFRTSISEVSSFAVATMDQYLNSPKLRPEERVSNPRVLTKKLSRELGYAVVMPATRLQDNYTLLGGRVATIRQIKTAYTLWQRDKLEYPLVQFEPTALNLTANEKCRTVCVPGFHRMQNGLCDVLVWSEEGRGYAFAMRHKKHHPLLKGRALEATTQRGSVVAQAAFAPAVLTTLAAMFNAY